MITKGLFALMMAAGLFVVPAVAMSSTNSNVSALVYKNAACGCCEGYVAHLRTAGYSVKTVNLQQRALDQLMRQRGVTSSLAACHTMVIGGYTVEGHMPLAALARLLAERPKIRGIALPGMPAGSPGMGGVKQGPFVIFVIGTDRPSVYARI